MDKNVIEKHETDGLKNLTIGIVQQACEDFLAYRKLYYRYGSLEEVAYTTENGKKGSYLDFLPPMPSGKLYRKAEDKEKYLRGYSIKFYSKVRRAIKFGKDAENFLLDKDGWYSQLLLDLDGRHLLDRLEEKASKEYDLNRGHTYGKNK